jgi:hypothetical protein
MKLFIHIIYNNSQVKERLISIVWPIQKLTEINFNENILSRVPIYF